MMLPLPDFGIVEAILSGSLLLLCLHLAHLSDVSPSTFLLCLLVPRCPFVGLLGVLDCLDSDFDCCFDGSCSMDTVDCIELDFVHLFVLGLELCTVAAAAAAVECPAIFLRMLHKIGTDLALVCCMSCTTILLAYCLQKSDVELAALLLLAVSGWSKL